ncbi:hypothetical protein [Streptomyces sp. NPDC047097]|uniref:hypothetical protein n=1 Tax=Streptomyces sp. NPDC047097 TaxID=3155260 RepID=UPI00340C6803
MTQPPHPFRVRLRGGRNVHAARTLTRDRITACDYYLASGAENHWLADTAEVTCPKCRRLTQGQR